MNVLHRLREAGIVVTRLDEPTRDDAARPDAILEVSAGDVEAVFAAEIRQRAPYPNELSRLESRRDRLSSDGRPLLIVAFLPEALGVVLTDAGWSWADGQGNFDLRAPGLTLRQRRTMTAPKVTRPGKLPQGSGSLAVIRALIRFNEGDDEGARATGLANEAGVSQPRASQVLSRLLGLELVQRTPGGRWLPRREALLDRFLEEYAGPGGSEQHLYSLDGPTDAVVRIVTARKPQHRIAVSADVGPDLIQPWRRPSIAVVYADDDIAPESVGLVEAQGRHDANVLVRVPDDRSVFRNQDLVATLNGMDVLLADESQQIWDLHDLGGADRLEAAGMLRQWLLTHP